MSHDPKALEALRIDRHSAPPPKPWVPIIIGLVVMLVLAGAGVYWLNRPRAVEVHTLVVQETTQEGNGNRTLLNASGYVTARRQATISAKETGKVVDVLVEEGMKVEADQVLAHLDSSNIQMNLNQAEAELESARRAIEEIKPGLDHAVREQARIEQLATGEFASKSDLERYATDAKVLQARLDHQTADIAVQERVVAVWKQQMDDAIIRAPFAGVVISKDAQPGEMISPISAGGGFTRTGICTIVDMNSLEVDVDVNESYINRVVPGQPAEATLDAYPDWKIPAKVIAIIPTADRQKATVRVRVGFDKLDPRILPDMSVKVAFEEAGPPPTAAAHDVTIPKAAVHEHNGQQLVWIVNNGKAEQRSVTLGATNGSEVSVSGGLSSGEKIILDGAENLMAGAIVTEAKP